VARGSVSVRDLPETANLEQSLSEEAEEEPNRAERLRPFHQLPLPPGARIRRESLDRAVVERPQAASPPPASSFRGLDDNGAHFPPDTDGAVGPNHVVTMLNSQFRVQDRDGNVLVTASIDSFWSSVSAGNPLTDPNVLYDPYADRWIADIITNLGATSTALLVGASATGDPTGTWNLYRVDVDGTGQILPDFPRLGFNKNWIAIQVNLFQSSFATFVKARVYAFDRKKLYGGGANASYTLFDLFNAGTTQVPAITYDPEVPVIYLLQEFAGNTGGSGFLRLWSLSGPVGSEVLTTISYPSTEETWGFGGTADRAPQKGGTAKIDLDWADFTSVVYRNGLITGAHTIFLPANLPTRTAIQWWQIATDGTVIQRGRIDDPTGQNFYAYPSAAVNRNNDVLIGYSAFSGQEFAAARYAFRAAGDPPGTMRDDQILKAGEAYYSRTIQTSTNRWGDYSVSSVDPRSDQDFWTLQEYAASPSTISLWGTWWGRIVPDSGPPVPMPVAAFGAATAAPGEATAFHDFSTDARDHYWDFGDGSTSREASPEHTYSREGAYLVTLMVVNQTGASRTSSEVGITQHRAAPVGVPRPPRTPATIPPR
jgi:hypothetical protein